MFMHELLYHESCLVAVSCTSVSQTA